MLTVAMAASIEAWVVLPNLSQTYNLLYIHIFDASEVLAYYLKSFTMNTVSDMGSSAMESGHTRIETMG